jgi:hypothetical protein
MILFVRCPRSALSHGLISADGVYSIRHSSTLNTVFHEINTTPLYLHYFLASKQTVTHPVSRSVLWNRGRSVIITTSVFSRDAAHLAHLYLSKLEEQKCASRQIPREHFSHHQTLRRETTHVACHYLGRGRNKAHHSRQSPSDLKLPSGPCYHVSMSAGRCCRSQLAAFCCSRRLVSPKRSKWTTRARLPILGKAIHLYVYWLSVRGPLHILRVVWGFLSLRMDFASSYL